MGGKSSHLGFMESIPHAVSSRHSNHALGGMGKNGNLYHHPLRLTNHPYCNNLIKTLIFFAVPLFFRFLLECNLREG